MVTAKMCAPFEFLTGQRAIIWKKIFAGHFGTKNGDAYQLPWQPGDDEMLSILQN
jgi:hypothetical protein